MLLQEAVEARLLAEMKGIKDQMDKRKKKERKRKHEQRVKARVRAAQLALGELLNRMSTPRQHPVQRFEHMQCLRHVWCTPCQLTTLLSLHGYELHCLPLVSTSPGWDHV